MTILRCFFWLSFFKVNSIQLQLGNESDSAIVLKFYSSTKKTKSFEKEINNFRYFFFVDGLYGNLFFNHYHFY